jgi:DNA-binding transcriptional regulator YdaS (Cro superfamily)
MSKKLESFFKAAQTKDKRLLDLREKALYGSSRAVINATLKADRYSGVLATLVAAGSTVALAAQLGVNYQAVQQWVNNGYVPLGRISEIEAQYGIPRSELMNPKYAAALAEPKFSDEA